MRQYGVRLIMVTLMCAQLGWAHAAPSPTLLLEAWQQLDANFRKTVLSYKLEGTETRKPHEAGLPSSDLTWRVWRDGSRFLWECRIHDTLSGDRRYMYAYDGRRYYCYVSPSSHGFIYKERGDMPPCENAFTSVYPFDMPHFWQSPLAGGNWQRAAPYYTTLFHRIRTLRVNRGKDNQTYTLLVSQEGVSKIPGIPDEIHFREDHSSLVPVRFILRDRGTAESTETVFEIASAQWYRDCWFPARYRWQWRDGRSGRLLMEATGTLRMYDINKPIPAKRFQINFPAGTLVTDEGGREKVVRGALPWLFVGIGVGLIVSWVILWLAKRRPRVEGLI